jgi:hypothetical protein
MRKYRFHAKAPDPRTLCVSYRDIAPVISRSIRYEFEDLIAAVDAVDVIAPAEVADPADAASPLRSGTRTLQRLAVKLGRRLQAKSEGLLPITGLRRLPSDVSHNYDIVFVSVERAGDLYDLGPSAMWRSVARVSMCYIQELYASDVPALGDLIKVLRGFDHIFVGYQGTIETLAEATGRQCHYLVPSTDTLKFCPYPEAPARVIDFYAMGRRPPKTHEALLRMAEAGGQYYMYDTVTNCPIPSHIEHRSRLAEMIKRSRFFLVNPARRDDPERTGGQEELGFRFVEGAAGGAVLVGAAPRNLSFGEEFGWQDAVTSLPFDSGEIADVIAELDADPDRVERIMKTNVVNSLRRHDHVYRWGQVLAIAGMKETKAMESRRRELEELAASIERTLPHTHRT